MSTRVLFPNSSRADDEARHSSSEVDQLTAAGRTEMPTGDLAQRVRDAVAYRKVLAEARPDWMPSARRPRLIRPSVVLGSITLAASALLWWHAAGRKSLPSIAPEPAATREQGQADTTNVSQHTVAGSSTHNADPCRAGGVASGNQPLIDDFEDGDDEVLRFESRSGLWRWARDTDAPRSAPALLPIPRPNPSATNRLALHVKGGRLLDWGAIVEFDFKPACYDASAYGGLAFQARGPGRVFVAPREIGTIPLAESGTCTGDCYNPHVKKVELERHWKTYRIEWSEFAERGYYRPALDPKRLHSIAFLIRPEDTPYDVWFDDVRFVELSRK